MQNKVKKLLTDILEAIHHIDVHTQGKRNFFIYRQNITMKRSVERELEIIGEAMNNLLKIKPDTAITAAKKIIDLRNFVIHAYDSVDDEMIWGILINHLPKLKTEVETLLKEK